MPEEQDVLRGVNGFLSWLEGMEKKEGKATFVKVETIVYSRKYSFIGTLDTVVKFAKSKKNYLMDYKTSTGIYPEVKMQTAAYQEAVEEESDLKIAGRWVIRLEKRSEAEFREEMDEENKPNEEYVAFEAVYLDDEPNYSDDLAGFLAAKHLFEWGKSAEKALEKSKIFSNERK
jgi:hypothetical protein